MSVFNKANEMAKMYSANGNLQAVKSEKQQAYELVINSMYGRDTMYETTDTKVSRLRDIVSSLVAKGEFDFLANLMVFARTEMHMRNMPILGTLFFIEALYNQRIKWPGTRTLVSRVIQRADQITDVLALIGTKSKMPMALKRGLSDAFNKFDAYQFAKYDRKGKVTFKDAMRVIHPVPKDEDQSSIFKQLMEGTLVSPDTWEVALSREGNTKEVWHGLIERNAIGFQALLKNLRNMLKADISVGHKRTVAAALVNGANRSKSLPFEFLASMDAIKEFDDNILNNALIQCMQQSVANVPKMGNKVLVMLDVSGSMQFDNYRAIKTASFLTAVLAASCADAEKFHLVCFGSDAKYVRLNTAESVYSNYTKLLEINGGSTNFAAALTLVNKSDVQYDTVFCLTDGEIDDLGNTRVGGFQPKAEKYVINCAAAESTPLPPIQNWSALAGWSTNLFKYIEAVRGGQSMVKQLSKPFV